MTNSRSEPLSASEPAPLPTGGAGKVLGSHRASLPVTPQTMTGRDES